MSQSHTELAARLRSLANWIDQSVWMTPEMSSAPKTIHEAAAALESPERVQGDEAATDPEDCNAWCPRCNGHGHDVEMSDSGPDAYEVMVNCRHCDGEGTLYAAYTGVVRELAKKHQAYLKACGELYFAKYAAHTPPTAPAQDAQGDELLRDLEALMNNNRITVSESTLVWRAMQRIAAAATPSPQAATAGAEPGWTQEEIEEVIACLGDDAAQLRDQNPEDERADNMDRAACMVQVFSDALRASTPAESDLSAHPDMDDVAVPPVGSRWGHSNGDMYTVIGYADMFSRNHQHRPPRVIYQAASNGRVWSRELSDWHRAMLPAIVTKESST